MVLTQHLSSDIVDIEDNIEGVANVINICGCWGIYDSCPGSPPPDVCLLQLAPLRLVPLILRLALILSDLIAGIFFRIKVSTRGRVRRRTRVPHRQTRRHLHLERPRGQDMRRYPRPHAVPERPDTLVSSSKNPWGIHSTIGILSSTDVKERRSPVQGLSKLNLDGKVGRGTAHYDEDRADERMLGGRPTRRRTKGAMSSCQHWTSSPATCHRRSSASRGLSRRPVPIIIVDRAQRPPRYSSSSSLDRARRPPRRGV